MMVSLATSPEQSYRTFMTPESIEQPKFDALKSRLDDRYEPKALELIELAFDFSLLAHGNQARMTGEPYFNHALATAIKLADLHLPAEVIAAGLLHDVPEDTAVTIEDIESNFGEDIASMVGGVTKLGHVQYRGMERYVENLRKMFLSMAADVRVIFIKFADRMHNMETLYVLPEAKRTRIAKEVREIYAPIANRLGMGEYRGLFEDYSFKYLQPKEYNWTKHLLEQRVKKYGEALETSIAEIETELVKNNIRGNVHGRIKYCYSLFKKLKKYDNDINKVYDIVAIRILVNDVTECYSALGLIHGLYTPLPGRIKDYIAQPKPNGYQSLHTTVFSKSGAILEFQIRTHEMHEEAEYGIAAHWSYKEGVVLAKTQVKWIEELAKIQKELDQENFMERLDELKLDMFQDRIFVFTPAGDVIDLPEYSTPIDFAYAVHTDLGNKISSAKINHQIANLDSTLKSGDMCEIITDRNRKSPNADWLKFVKTNQARSKIRDGLKKSKKSLLSTMMSFGKKN